MPDLQKQDFVVGKWHVQPSLNLVSCDEAVTRLEPKVMAVLVCLAEHAGEVVTKEQLMRAAWPDAYVTDQVLTHAIWQLRQAQQKQQGRTVTQYCSPYDIAAIYAALGERARMLQWLRTADMELDPKLLQSIRTDPPFDRYRADPEFIAVVDSVGRPR